MIASHAEGWAFDRIAPLERNIMRVALYEVEHRDDVPTEVALDEAVSLAKEYCGADAPGFVNGILGAAVRADRERGGASAAERLGLEIADAARADRRRQLAREARGRRRGASRSSHARRRELAAEAGAEADAALREAARGD